MSVSFQNEDNHTAFFKLQRFEKKYNNNQYYLAIYVDVIWQLFYSCAYSEFILLQICRSQFVCHNKNSIFLSDEYLQNHQSEGQSNPENIRHTWLHCSENRPKVRRFRALRHMNLESLYPPNLKVIYIKNTLSLQPYYSQDCNIQQQARKKRHTRKTLAKRQQTVDFNWDKDTRKH